MAMKLPQTVALCSVANWMQQPSANEVELGEVIAKHESAAKHHGTGFSTNARDWTTYQNLLHHKAVQVLSSL